MTRNEIIEIIGKDKYVSNIENGEWSYARQLSEGERNKLLDKNAKDNHKFLDIRFENEKLIILVETKDKIKKNLKLNKAQLQSYVNFESKLNKAKKKIIAILASTGEDEVLVYAGDNNLKLNDSTVLKDEKNIKSFEYYEDLFFGVKNNKEEVMKNTYELNELLHKYGIREDIRSQFVGTCLLSLKYNLTYKNLSTKQISSGIESILEQLLNDNINKAGKIWILKSKIIESQDVQDLKDFEFEKILNFIEMKILPFINDKSTQGQDLLNLFFTAFNKYVGKKDKNQAFTPDHIVKFMCEIAEINKNSTVLDPCCGSGSFLVRAMTMALDDCNNENEKKEIKQKRIWGIEYEEGAFGLATTNMLIHGDGNSNIIQGSCFDKTEEWYNDAKINVVLMNPPYNASKKHSNPEYTKTWDKKTSLDPSKGFHFVYDVAKKVKTGKLLVLLPTACAIGTSEDIEQFKRKMLDEHTLLAVFSLPQEIFYPGASASACCMVFELGKKHEKAAVKETFFGYFKDDGFIKRKNLGRVEKIENGVSLWEEISSEWKNLYFKRIEKPGLSVLKQVSYNDEWLPEAYMETDYSKLTHEDFEKTIREFISYKIKFGDDKNGTN
ncbi:HsdM family class I SAM-dependent methyltransferase [Mycoplasmopsis gallinarum]